HGRRYEGLHRGHRRERRAHRRLHLRARGQAARLHPHAGDGHQLHLRRQEPRHAVRDCRAIAVRDPHDGDGILAVSAVAEVAVPYAPTPTLAPTPTPTLLTYAEE